MTDWTKKNIAILLIVIIGIGSGVGVGIFLLFFDGWQSQEEEVYPWSASDCPGAPSSITSDQIIKIGCAGDTGTIQGDANYNGTLFAAQEINEAGGIDVNGETYYFGVTSEDTDECNVTLDISRSVSAAKRLIKYKKVDFVTGGFRSEALTTYVEEFMDAKTIFFGTGALDDILCKNVIDDYDTYKYFFRFMPINSTELAFQIIETLVDFIIEIENTYPEYDVREIGVLAENSDWTDPIITLIETYLLYYYTLKTGIPFWEMDVLTPILFDTNINGSDMNMHLQSLESDGADIVIPLISGSGGISMMQQYELNQYDYLIFGVDEQSQLDTFWEDSGESCAYETIIQGIYRTNMSNTTIAFWDAFIAEYPHEPLYNAAGAYDAVNCLKDAIVETQSLETDDIIAHIETWTPSNPRSSVLGVGAWWSNSHDLVGGYPYRYPLWCQWQPDGTKIVIPTSIYPNSLATGNYTMPPWVLYKGIIPETWVTPGVSGIPEEQWIKIGMMGDIGELQGDQNYQGGYLAARKINQEGGIVVNGTSYYVAVAAADTDEAAQDFSTAAGVAAADRMIYSLKCQYAVGGSTTESLLAYREPFMDNDIPFLSTGVMADIFTENVRDNYARYNYYWRISPYNSSYSSSSFVINTLSLYSYLLTIYGPDDINHIGILAEDLPWTEGIRMVIPSYIDGAFGAGTVPAGGVIAFDPEVTPSVMNSHLETLEIAGCDVVLIAISGEAGIVMSQMWAAAERPFLLFGSNLHAQTAGYWEKTNGDCEYEIGQTTATRCNKTVHTIEFYDTFFNEFNEHPIYIGFGAYDAVNLIVDSIEKTQSFDPDDFVADIETYNTSNPKHGGAGGDPVAWNSNHDLIAGYPFSYGVWFQWQSGIKTLIPSYTPYLALPPEYPSTLAPMGTMQLPDWITWDVGP
ncbi:MAG: ABC transporter substrate-binding protein [Promethearchaeota archaeon]